MTVVASNDHYSYIPDSFKKDLTHYYAKYDMQQWDAYIPNNVMTGTPNQMDPNEFA